jgi:TolB protein
LAIESTALTPTRDSYPHLSPDSRSLLFHSDRSGERAIWIAGGDGSEPRVLFDGGNAGIDPSTPVWSPDGQRIAFAMRPADATNDEESEIYVMRRDGTAVQRLTAIAGDDSHPHWSADGKRIFFNSPRATPDPKASWGSQWHDIYSMAADGGDVRRHTDCRTVCTYPVPSPDGRFIAFRKIVESPGLSWGLEPGARNSEVFVTAINGSASTNVSNNGAFDGWPMWSPNGRWLVFASNRDKVASTGQIYAVRPDGSDLRRLTMDRMSRAQPSFSSDGKTLFFYEHVEDPRFEIGHIASLKVDLPD